MVIRNDSFLLLVQPEVQHFKLCLQLLFSFFWGGGIPTKKKDLMDGGLMCVMSTADLDLIMTSMTVPKWGFP